MSQCGSFVFMRSQTIKKQMKKACTCPHKSGSTGLFRTSSCQKHFDFFTVHVQVTVAFDQQIYRLNDYISKFAVQEYQHTAHTNVKVQTACPSIQVHTSYPSIQVLTAYPNIQVVTATDALAVYGNALQFCQSLSASFCRYNSSNLCFVYTNPSTS